MRRQVVTAWAAVSMVCSLTARPLHAQQAAAPPAPTVGPFDLTVNWRTRVEAWDWFEGPVGDSAYGFGHSMLRIGIGQTRPSVDWQVEAEAVTILGLPSGAVAPPPQGQLGLGGTYYVANENTSNNANAFVKQAFVNLKHLGPTTLKLGRFEFFDGAEVRPADSTVATLVQTRIAHRLISNFGVTAVQRTFDGGQFGWNAGSNNVTAFAGRPTEGIFQVDGMGELDVQVYYGAFNKVVKTTRGAGSLRIFGVGYVDDRQSVLKSDNRPAAVRAADHDKIKLATVGADYVHAINTPHSGVFDVLGWGVVQTGAWGTLTQRAAAFVAEAGWQPPSNRWKPWLSAGYSYGSGDGNPADGRNGTFFQLLPTPRQYARFPFYNMMNNEDVYGMLNLQPTPKLSLRSEVHGLRLASASDLWYLGGGAFQSGTFGYTGRPSHGSQDLATVADLSADYRFWRAVSATVYYCYASGGHVVSGTYPDSSTGQLAYVETTVRF